MACYLRAAQEKIQPGLCLRGPLTEMQDVKFGRRDQKGKALFWPKLIQLYA